MAQKIDKEIIIIGDTEFGVGNLTDDFISDKALAKLINTLTKRKHGVDFVINGDVFDFLKAPIIRKGKEYYPRHITEKISLEKLALMVEAHKPVFTALKAFVKEKRHRMVFVIGNHDQDLYFPGVQAKLKSLLGSKKRVIVTENYDYANVHAEHGHDYDLLNKSMFTKSPFLKVGSKTVLDLPWLSYVVITRMSKIKQTYPFAERIKPLPVLFEYKPTIPKKIGRSVLGYTVKSVFYYPLRHLFDRTYRIPWYLLKNLINRFRSVDYEVNTVMRGFKNSIKGEGSHIYVLGHIHDLEKSKHGKSVFLHPDTWRDEYKLNKKTGVLTPKKKHYVQVIVKNNQSTWKLKHWPIKREVFSIKAVAKDELKHIKLARKQEGYVGRPLPTG